MSKRKLELGKGLKALISDIDEIDIEKRSEKVKQLASSVADILIANIEVNPYQPRTEFDETALAELSASIKEHGLIQPITVRSLNGEKFQLISGERRLRASKMAGLKKIPAYIRIADDQGMLELALIENVQRENLNPLEIALGYQRLIDECSLTHQEMSDRIGKTRTSVTNYLRLLKLPPSIKSGLRNELISMGHARALAGLSDPALQLALYKEIVSEKLSVRETEKRAKHYSREGKKTKVKEQTPASSLSREWRDVQDELTKLLDTHISIKINNKGNGRMVINFDDVEHFNDILDIIRK